MSDGHAGEEAMVDQDVEAVMRGEFPLRIRFADMPHLAMLRDEGEATASGAFAEMKHRAEFAEQMARKWESLAIERNGQLMTLRSERDEALAALAGHLQRESEAAC